MIFDVARVAIRRSRLASRAERRRLAVPARSRPDRVHRRNREPGLVDAPEVVARPRRRPGAGGTILLVQKWVHDAAAWEGLRTTEQERVIGRTKRDSVELDHKPAASHVASTDQDRFGKIFRRNIPYGTVAEHGTMFVGFSAEPSRSTRCWGAWSGRAGAATRSPLHADRSPARTTSSRRSNRSTESRRSRHANVGLCSFNRLNP